MYVTANDLLNKSARKIATEILTGVYNVIEISPRDNVLNCSISDKHKSYLVFEIDMPEYNRLQLSRSAEGKTFNKVLEDAVIDASFLFAAIDYPCKFTTFVDSKEVVPAIRRMPILTKFELTIGKTIYDVQPCRSLYKNLMKKFYAIAETIQTRNFSKCGEYDRAYPTKALLFEMFAPKYKLSSTPYADRYWKDGYRIKGSPSRESNKLQIQTV